MAIVSFDQDEVIDYIPEEDRGSDDPCVVKMKYVSFSRMKQYQAMIQRQSAAQSRGIKDPSKQIEIAAEIGRRVQKQQFVENVVAIENYLVKGQQITDPAEFYEKADTELIYELLKAMESSAKLTEGQRKN